MSGSQLWVVTQRRRGDILRGRSASVTIPHDAEARCVSLKPSPSLSRSALRSEYPMHPPGEVCARRRCLEARNGATANICAAGQSSRSIAAALRAIMLSAHAALLVSPSISMREVVIGDCRLPAACAVVS